jgi:L-seryl-tRNA(Ser) seleniumtransferase
MAGPRSEITSLESNIARGAFIIPIHTATQMESVYRMPDDPAPAQDPRRSLPSVERLLASPHLKEALADHGRALATEVAREVLADARAGILAGAHPPEAGELACEAVRRLAALGRGTLCPVINATGVIIHTNLGRAPLSAAARGAIESVAAGYSNLEYDLTAGERGSRYLHAERLLCRLTGAEGALVVNNNAGALFLALSALAQGRDVVISRGQLVEIGGGFRIPDVLRQSGARLVEVGTTNRTHIADYRAAANSQTALLLRVHYSNFRQVGFIADVSLAEMVALGHSLGVWVLDDLGSGSLLDTTLYGLASEPMVQQSIAAGADLVTFSGDKLLGGPQAGLIVGREELVAQLRNHPLARVLRVGKDTLAALQATLLHYLRGEAEREVPVWRMISLPLESLSARAHAWVNELRAREVPASVVQVHSTIGGGSLPGEVLPTFALALVHPFPDALTAALRSGQPPVVARILADQVILDPRTVPPEADATLIDVLTTAWRATG